MYSSLLLALVVTLGDNYEQRTVYWLVKGNTNYHVDTCTGWALPTGPTIPGLRYRRDPSGVRGSLRQIMVCIDALHMDSYST